ncbi:Mor transcription activator family protein [Paenibacillus hamazuiensis]|uniref:Mor transcription activator family protein n=1 Tax=Paenibacillus hamazuiensis TaxID=2936508 RepID=UPI00200FE317|nr:Mor transcription activator family protein [Paenibacillus hamazuiensis]
MEDWMKELSLDLIPNNLHPLVEMTGIETFLKLCSYYGGSNVYFPRDETMLMPLRNQRIKQEYNGHNLVEICRKFRLSERQTRHILNKQ